MASRLLARMPVKIWLTPEDVRQGRKEPKSPNIIGLNFLRYEYQAFNKH